MIAIVRIRGLAKMQREINDTMQMLNLRKVNECTVIPKNETYLGMIKKINDYVTYGEITKETFKKMLLKRGEIVLGGKVTEEYLQKNKQTLDKFIDSFFEKKIKLQDAGIKPRFRLHPPKKGHGGIKRPFKLGGALGYRGDKINELLERMI